MDGQLHVTASKDSLSLSVSPVICKELNPAKSHMSLEANPSPVKPSGETPVLADTLAAFL